MSHTITNLREQLFNTLSALQDKTNPMDIERAKAISEISQVIINSAKVEVDHMRVSGGLGSGFMAENKTETRPQIGQQTSERTASGTKTITQIGEGLTITRHKAS